MKRPTYSTSSPSSAPTTAPKKAPSAAPAPVRPAGASGVGQLLQKDRSALTISTIKPGIKDVSAANSAQTNVGAAATGERLTPEQLREAQRRRWMLPDSVTGLGGRTIYRIGLDPASLLGRPWGPYLAIKGVPVYTDDSALISLVDARAFSPEPSTVTGALVPVSTPVPFSSSGDPAEQIDRAITVDARIRSMLSIEPRLPGGELVVAIETPAVDDRSPVRSVGRLFLGQEFWATGRGEPSTSAQVEEGVGLLPSGEFLMARKCTAVGPEPRSDGQWTREKVQVFLFGPQRQSIPGPQVDHWCDLSAAQWWFRIGYALASDNSIIAALDNVDATTGCFFGTYPIEGISEEELLARRARAKRELVSVLSLGTHPVGSANWNGALDFHVENRGLSPGERDMLRYDQRLLHTLSDRSPYDLRPSGWEAQVTYVRAIAECIARGFNDLNIPWYIDPISRNLYRDWFAGHDSSDFDAQKNHNDGRWFTNKEQCGEKRFAVLRPRIPAGAWNMTSVGEMPARLSAMWDNLVDRNDPRTLEFLQRAGVLLWAGSDTQDPYRAASAENRGFATGATTYGPTDALSGYWWDVGPFANVQSGDVMAGLPEEIRAQYAVGGDSVRNHWWHRKLMRPEFFGQDWYAQIINAPPLQPRNRIADWRTGGFDHPGVAGVHVQGTVPLRWYIAYFREWLRSLCMDDPVSADPAPDMPKVRADRRWSGFRGGYIPRRDVATILQQSLSAALDTNLTWGTIYGSQELFASAMADQVERFGRAEPNQIIRGITGAVTAVGTQVSNALLPGVGALVGSGIDFIGSMLSVAIPTYRCEEYGRDDLGRPKPSFERSTLSGDPARDQPPSLSVPVPPGFCRSRIAIPYVELQVPSAPNLPPPAETTGSSVWTVLVPAGLATIGVAAAVYGLRRR